LELVKNARLESHKPDVINIWNADHASTLVENHKREMRTMARTSIQKHVIRHQSTTFSDWFAELRDLSGERWFEVAQEAPCAFAIWSGGGSPAQALFVISSILPKQQAA
jgi:hypothetical protein